MLGAVLNANNTRLDASTIAYILDHGNAGVLLVDTEFSELAAEAVTQSGRDLLVIDIEDSEGLGGKKIGALTYEHCYEADPNFTDSLPDNEWDALALNYTSGTTGRPRVLSIPIVVPDQCGQQRHHLGNAASSGLP